MKVATQSSNDLFKVTPSTTRLLYFSEEPINPNDPNSDTKFFVTKQGDTPAVFSMNSKAAITTIQGEVEDWIIENRSGEVHEFHIHQLHFFNY